MKLENKNFAYHVENDSKGAIANFFISEENHLLEYLLIVTLEKMPHVLECGSFMPHPREPTNVVHLKTDGSVTAVSAFKKALETISRNISQIKSKFQKELEATNQKNITPKTDDENEDISDK